MLFFIFYKFLLFINFEIIFTFSSFLYFSWFYSLIFLVFPISQWFYLLTFLEVWRRISTGQRSGLNLLCVWLLWRLLSVASSFMLTAIFSSGPTATFTSSYSSFSLCGILTFRHFPGTATSISVLLTFTWRRMSNCFHSLCLIYHKTK